MWPPHVQLRISFGWMDAFNRGCTTNKYSWDFEAACVWYNVGAIHSLMGAHQDRSSTSGIKGAHQHFQKAVAVFSHIKNELVTDLQGTLPAEFTQSGLDLCIEIHRGHAQSCFYEKAKMAGMKPGVLARLAMQASQYYDSALTHAQVRVCCTASARVAHVHHHSPHAGPPPPAPRSHPPFPSS